MNSVQKNFDEMVEEFHQHSHVPSNEELLRETEQVKWNCKNELLELRHNFGKIEILCTVHLIRDICLFRF